MIIDKDLYVTRISKGSSAKTGKREKKCYRNWFLIKASSTITGATGQIRIKHISFPRHFIGKRVRLKVEIIQDKKEGDTNDN